MATLNLNATENVYLYKGGEVRISNSAQEAEQLRRQGWSETAPEGVEVDEDAMAEAELAFVEGMQPELEGENVTPTNPSGAETPPDVQRQMKEDQAASDAQAMPKADTRKASGRGAVMSTRDGQKFATTPDGQRVQMPKSADDEALAHDFPGREVLVRNALTTPNQVRAHKDLRSLDGMTPVLHEQIQATLKTQTKR